MNYHKIINFFDRHPAVLQSVYFIMQKSNMHYVPTKKHYYKPTCKKQVHVFNQTLCNNSVNKQHF